MKLGILVDGQAEYHSLPLILDKIETDVQVLTPLYCDMQPHAPPAQIAYVAMKKMHMLLRRGISKVVVLIDRENRRECVPGMKNAIERELRDRLIQVDPNVEVFVVLKVRAFENWLIADPKAFAKLRGMFQYRKRIEKAVVPDKADNLDALDLLKRCSRNGCFEKVKGAKAVCKNLDPRRAAENSRSFRRFLRVVGDPLYSTQSKRPL